MKKKVGIVGKRGLFTMAGFMSSSDVVVEAFCDLDEDVLKKAAKDYGIPKTYRVYEDMLASDIDAVVVATPMHYHVPQTLQALEAGKHVLCEVTAGVSMEELWWLKEAVEKHRKVYMMAENYCYIPEVKQIEAMVEKGLFGDIYFGEGEYIDNIQYVIGRSKWRRYWQLGRQGSFYPTHSIGPVMKWFKGDRIKSIICAGTGKHTAPEFKQEDTTLALCQLESGKLVKIRVDCLSNRPHGMTYYSLQGTKGCYEAPRGLGDDHKIFLTDYTDEFKPEQGPKWRPLKDFNEYLPARYKNATAEQKASGHWGGDFFIVQDFIDSIVKGTKPAVDVYDACEWTAVALLSEISIRNNGHLMEMPNFRK